MNFLALQDKILGFLHRPASEMRTIVKDEINAVLLHTQRLHEFKFSERLVEIAYPANTQMVRLTGACEGTPRNILNIQLLSSVGASYGQPLKIRTFNSLIQRRLKYEKLNSNSSDGPYNPHDNFVANARNFDAFLINDAVGLYPTPSENKALAVNLYIWLPALVDDEDTNFFTELAYDYVIDSTLSRLHLYLKDDARSEELDKRIATSFEALRLWDSQVREVTSDE